MGFSAVYGVDRVGYHVKATNIAARVMIGDNEWGRSVPVPFSINKEDVDGIGLLKASPEIECYDAETRKQTKISIRRIRFGNKSFLFTNDGNRLCEIPNDDIPEVFFDSEKGLVSISFSKGKRTILYNPRTAKVIHEQDGK